MALFSHLLRYFKSSTCFLAFFPPWYFDLPSPLIHVKHCFQTSALQRSDLTRNLDLRWVRDEGLKGASLVTIFAPTNRAFDALPKRLRSYLFSPFGERALKKLLQYHIIPNTVLHSSQKFPTYEHFLDIHSLYFRLLPHLSWPQNCGVNSLLWVCPISRPISFFNPEVIDQFSSQVRCNDKLPCAFRQLFVHPFPTTNREQTALRANHVC